MWSRAWIRKSFKVPGETEASMFVAMHANSSETHFCYDITDFNQTPKLVKIFCNQLDESQALTPGATHLLTVLPYKGVKYFNYTTTSSVPVKLWPRLSDIEFKLTDENNRQLDLVTGLTTFIHSFSRRAARQQHETRLMLFQLIRCFK